METTASLDLNQLKRDWVEGVSGDVFFQCLQRRILRIESSMEEANLRGVLIVERDPVAFIASFFAAVSVEVPVILGNTRWQRLEWETVYELVNPAVIFGDSPLTEERREGFLYPKVGRILIATGGSSGGVKFAIHSWRTLVAACEGFQDLLGRGPVNSCCMLPLYHVSGLMQVLRSFLSGGQIAFTDLKEVQLGKFPAFPEGSLCLSLVSTQLQRLMAQKRIVNHLLLTRAIFIGGGPTAGSVIEQARALKLPLVLSYGMTETAAMVTALPPDDFLLGQTNAGYALKHAKVRICSEVGEVCPDGEFGRIHIEGSSLFEGYHGVPASSPEGSYRTDDEGYYDESGHLHIIGRADRLIISGGEKIDPKEVEAAIIETGAVEQVLVLGWPSEEWGEALVAFFVLSGVITDERKWEAALRRDLSNHKIPKLMIEVPSLPLDLQGKVDRNLMESLIETHLRKK